MEEFNTTIQAGDVPAGAKTKKAGATYVSASILASSGVTKESFWTSTRPTHLVLDPDDQETIYYPVTYQRDGFGRPVPYYPDPLCRATRKEKIKSRVNEQKPNDFGGNGTGKLGKGGHIVRQKLVGEIGTRFYHRGNPLALIDPYLTERVLGEEYIDVCRCEVKEDGEVVDVPVFRIYPMPSQHLVRPATAFDRLTVVGREAVRKSKQDLDARADRWRQEGIPEEVVQNRLQHAVIVSSRHTSGGKRRQCVLFEDDMTVVVQNEGARVIFVTPAICEAFPIFEEMNYLSRAANDGENNDPTGVVPKKETFSRSMGWSGHGFWQRKLSSIVKDQVSEGKVVFYPVAYWKGPEGLVKLYPDPTYEYYHSVNRSDEKRLVQGPDCAGLTYFVNKNPLEMIDRDLVVRAVPATSLIDIYRAKKDQKTGRAVTRRVLGVHILSYPLRAVQRQDLSSLRSPQQRDMFQPMEEDFLANIERYREDHRKLTDEEWKVLAGQVTFVRSTGYANGEVNGFTLFPTTPAIVVERRHQMIALATPAARTKFPRLASLLPPTFDKWLGKNTF